jgi:hypothetical protein
MGVEPGTLHVNVISVSFRPNVKFEVYTALHLGKPGRFTPGESDPSTRWIGGWVDHRAICMLWSREKSLSLAGYRTPAVKPVTRRCTDFATRLLLKKNNKSMIFL